jgi:multimeric flavodoxin WrbA
MEKTKSKAKENKVKIRVLGVSGTPIKGGNCDTMVQEALKVAESLGDVETEFITMAGKKVAMCQHCQYCIKHRVPCKIKDDHAMIVKALRKADGWLLAGPTWGFNIAPPLLNLFSRFRYYTFFTDEFRNKVTAALTVGYFGAGMEHALDSIHRGIVVAKAAAVASTAAFGERPAYLEHGVLDDKAGMRRVSLAAIRVVEVTRMIKFAQKAGVGLSEEQMITPGARFSKKDKKFVKGAWRDA